jgi:RNA recognition motif-containing protein
MIIFVSKLNLQTQAADLTTAFAHFGKVTGARLISDPLTGKSQGCAFVVVPNEEEALTAIEKLNYSILNGSTIRVQKAEPRETPPSRNGSNAEPSGNRSRDNWQ